MRHLLSVAVACLSCAACGDDDATNSPVQCVTACTTPPATECADSGTLRTWATPGACNTAGVCVYGHVDFACEHGCAEGACLAAVDPCADVVCDEPPATTCDGAALVTWASLGTCDDGQCAYASVSLACELGCADGACVGDPCNGVVCDDPPSPCHAATGTCSSGVCSYAVLTGAACDDGAACTDDDRCGANGTCAGTAIACVSPPAATCDGDTLRVPAATGTCADGRCDYPVTEVACADGCAAGACKGDPCEGVVCDDAPSGCYAAVGSCENGVCAYAFDNGAACDDGDACSDDDRCQNGTCAGAARACTTPGAPRCKDSETLLARSASGTCAAGACSYVEIEVPCAFGCVESDAGVGGCKGDPCAGVTCTNPPAASCANTTSLVVPAATGVCSGGACAYDNVVFTCTHGCDAAASPASCKPPEGLVIAEVLVDSTGFPDADAFIEIHGPPGTDLAGVSIVAVNGNGGADYATIALSGTLDSQGLFVVAHPDAASADLADLLDAEVDLQNGPDSVRLRYGALSASLAAGARVLDALAYGTFDAEDVARGEGTPVAVAAVNQSLARDRAFTDTDDNAADFHAGAPTPAAPPPEPETPPVAALACPTTIDVGAVAHLDAGASTGAIASWAFDFGDSASVSGTEAAVDHTYAAAGDYTARVTVTTAGGLSDDATCAITVVAVEAPVTYQGDELCFDDGATYKYDVLSNPAAPTTDGLLTLRFKGTSPYGPRPYVVQLQTGADTWVDVAETVDSKAGVYQTQRFRVPRETLAQAITAMGWLRFRHGSQYSQPSDCMTLTLAYNCEACFACPAGQEDLGIGCQPVDAPYDYTALEHATGRCSTPSFDQLFLPGTPPAAGDGTFSIAFVGCGPTSIDVEMYTANSGWVDIGSGSGPSCSFGSATWTVPEAYLDAAVSDGHAIRFRWSLDDNCQPGVGCEGYNDPCVKNARLTYPR